MSRCHVLLATALVAAVCVSEAARADDTDQAVANPLRGKAHVARDAVRHPAEELRFFGVRPDATVVEIAPGGGYWTEILSSLLFGAGTYYVALPGGTDPDDAREAAAFRARMDKEPVLYRHIKLTEFGVGHPDIVPPGTADFVLTFRNLHNWMEEGDADEVIASFYRALKPGGVLGIEEHRARADRPQDPKADNGYVRQDYATALIEKAGFKLVASSEMNANPRDTKDWPRGVWTLPPTFAMGEKDHAKYAAIGEADNFVLKFVKPAR
jgi:predicted methyltransferase